MRLSGYGGSNVPLQLRSTAAGAAWLRLGALACANVRGGAQDAAASSPLAPSKGQPDHLADAAHLTVEPADVLVGARAAPDVAPLPCALSGPLGSRLVRCRSHGQLGR